MNVSDFTTEQIDFLSRFFGPGNTLRWDAFCSGSMATSARLRLSPFIDDIRKSGVTILLPHVSETTKNSTTWYGLASDSRQARALKEQLNAFVGPTYTDFTGQQAPLDERDPAEAALKQYFAPHVFRLRVLKSNDRQEVHQQMERLRNLRDKHPDRTTQLVRPIGRILRDLEMAILVRNETNARRCLDDLRTRGRLSAHNLAFLNVRILAAFERWSELRKLPTFEPLLDHRRPVRVTEALLRCIYEEHFTAFEAEGNAPDCITAFRDKESTFGTLFRVRSPITDPAILKTWLLRAVARDDHEQAEALLNEIPTDHHDRHWAESLAIQITQVREKPEPATASIVERAHLAIDADNFDAAFQLLLKCEATVDVIRQVIICAEEINTLETTQQAVSFVRATLSDCHEKALSRRSIARAWEELISLVGGDDSQPEPIAIPDGWDSWLHQLNTAGPWPDAVDVAKRGSQEWSASRLESNPAFVEQIADQLTAGRSHEATTIIRTILPDLIRFFLPDDGPVREFKPVYMSLIYLLSLDDAIGADDLVALECLAEAVLESAPSTKDPDDYADLLESLETAWQQVRSFRHVEWAMSVLDLLIAFNVRQHAPVDRFLHNLIDGFRDWSRRVGADQWELIDLLASDLGQADLLQGLRPEESPETDNTVPRTDHLNDKTVAIYTLTERIGRRAAQLIERAFAGVKVHLLHDKVASGRLIQLAKSADIMIVNTWDAKHAATNGIKHNRATAALTLHPDSKTPMSLVACLNRYVDSTCLPSSFHES